MQFMPATWASYGVDADGDGKADPYDPVDAIFSAANLLAQDGAGRDLAGAVWLYNHSDHYVQTVLALAHAYETGGAEPAGIDLAASPAAHAGGPFSPALLW
jgi:membrane-bound lytic murein transglycosylase B